MAASSRRIVLKFGSRISKFGLTDSTLPCNVSTTTPFMHLPFTWTSQFDLEHLASDCPVEAVELDIYEDFRFWYVFTADSQFTA